VKLSDISVEISHSYTRTTSLADHPHWSWK